MHPCATTCDGTVWTALATWNSDSRQASTTEAQTSEDECHRLSRVVSDAFQLYAKNESSCSGGFVCPLACVEFGLHLAQRQLSLQFIFKRLSLPNRGTDKPAKKSNESDQNGRIGR